ncbi:Zn(2)-C6 fungal-type domain-containing protein [Fusarium sp. Ph1]|nr:Zn(2)-C6 fungal-type domain-containing protein [Fusarium sp. Ph1]
MPSNPSPGPTSDVEMSVSSASGPRQASRGARRYGFACARCKSRKIKCSGDQPVCKGCQKNGEDCVWPSQDLSDLRLRHANARIRWLEASLLRRSRSPQIDLPGNTQPNRASPRQSTCAVANTDTSPAVSTTTSSTAADVAYPSSATEIWFQVGIGEDGGVVYNGPTSRFHAGALESSIVPTSEASNVSTLSVSEPKRAAHVETLRSQWSLMDSAWLPLIRAKPLMNGTGVDTKVGMALLDIYWTWLHPLHNCVYRPCLVMDLALGGQYCSDFLLMCIFALAARHLPEQDLSCPDIGKGEDFVKRAKELLLQEMAADKPTIPTIQGLLILGGRQCAVGKSSEGWLYTGMAIRMMIDIGLHLDTPKLAELQRWTPAETETRKRLYNSAYIWDKTLSLALGRPPSLIRRPYPSTDILDKFDDARDWEPIHAVEVSNMYTPTPSWNSTTFCTFCQLHELTTEMMLLFSNTPSTEDFATNINDLDARFRTWYDEMPPSLKISDVGSLQQSPPPHIISLNLLYHALHILLRRPFLSSRDSALRASSTSVCVAHSKKIHAMYSLYARTFPHRLMTYQISYCIFSAATVEAQILKTATSQAEREDAAERLACAIRVLQNEAAHTPGSGRSLDTIRRMLNAGLAQPLWSGDRSSSCSSGLHRQPHTAADGESDGLSRTRTHLGPEAPQPSAGDISSAPEDISAFTIGQDCSWWDQTGYTGLDTGAGFHPDSFSWGMANVLPQTLNVLPLPDQGWNAYGSMG